MMRIRGRRSLGCNCIKDQAVLQSGDNRAAVGLVGGVGAPSGRRFHFFARSRPSSMLLMAKVRLSLVISSLVGNPHEYVILLFCNSLVIDVRFLRAIMVYCDKSE